MPSINPTLTTFSAYAISANPYIQVVWNCSSTVYRVRAIWLTYRTGMNYLNPDNLLPNLTGMVIANFPGKIVKIVFGDNVIIDTLAELVKSGFKGVMFLSRVIAVFEQQQHVADAWNQWLEAVSKNLPIDPKTPLFHFSNEQAKNHRHSWWHNAAKSQALRIQRIALCTFNLAASLFDLSMEIMNVLDFFFLDKKGQEELWQKSLRESPQHLDRCLMMLVTNKEAIKKGLDNLEEVIGSFFSTALEDEAEALQVKKHVTDYISESKNCVDQIVNIVHPILVLWKKASHAVSDCATDLLSLATPEDLRFLVDDYLKRNGKNNLFVNHKGCPRHPPLPVKANLRCMSTNKNKYLEITSKVNPLLYKLTHQSNTNLPLRKDDPRNKFILRRN